MRDHPLMKRAQLGEVPVEAAARDAKLARQNIRLERVEALARQRRQSGIDPVLSRQPLGHKDAPYSTVLTATIGALMSDRPCTAVWSCMEVAYAGSGASGRGRAGHPRRDRAR